MKEDGEEMEEQEMNGVMVLRPSWPKAFMIDDMLFSSYLLCYVRPSTVEMCLVTTPGHKRSLGRGERRKKKKRKRDFSNAYITWEVEHGHT